MPRSRYSVGGTFYGRDDSFYHSDTRYAVGGTFYGKSASFQHWGIPGMQWGKRRFQEEDGSLTAAGRRRYGVGDALGSIGNAIGGAANSAGRAIGNAAQNYAQTWSRGASRIYNGVRNDIPRNINYYKYRAGLHAQNAARAIGDAAGRYANEAGRHVQNATRAVGQAVGSAARQAIPAASQALGFDARRNMLEAESRADNANKRAQMQDNLFYARQRRQGSANGIDTTKQMQARDEAGRAAREMNDARDRYNSTPLGMLENAGRAIGGAVDSAGRKIDSSLNLGIEARKERDAAKKEVSEAEQRLGYALDQGYNSGRNLENYVDDPRNMFGKREERDYRSEDPVYNELTSRRDRAEGRRDEYESMANEASRSADEAARNALSTIPGQNGERFARQFQDERNAADQAWNNYEKQEAINTLYGLMAQARGQQLDDDYNRAYNEDQRNLAMERKLEDRYRNAQQQLEMWDKAYGNSLSGKIEEVLGNVSDWLYDRFKIRL